MSPLVTAIVAASAIVADASAIGRSDVMKVYVRLEFFGVDTDGREALQAFCERHVGRALAGDRHRVERAVVVLRRDVPTSASPRWAARVELTLTRPGARELTVNASAPRPHAAVEDAALAAWSQLHVADAQAVL
jgi:hypothetical protein